VKIDRNGAEARVDKPHLRAAARLHVDLGDVVGSDDLEHGLGAFLAAGTVYYLGFPRLRVQTRRGAELLGFDPAP